MGKVLEFSRTRQKKEVQALEQKSIFDFNKAAQDNQAKKDKMAQDRKIENKSVLRSYRIKD